jgi:hypothetical protein
MRDRIQPEASTKSHHGVSRWGSRPEDACIPRQRIFLLSPAKVAGLRAKAMLQGSMRSDLAVRLRGQSAPLGEIFSFISGLYFRGKLAYARAFATPPPRISGVAVITPSAGFVSPKKRFNLEQLRELSSLAIDAAESRHRIRTSLVETSRPDGGVGVPLNPSSKIVR